jgi:hypothetical protein
MESHHDWLTAQASAAVAVSGAIVITCIASLFILIRINCRYFAFFLNVTSCNFINYVFKGHTQDRRGADPRSPDRKKRCFAFCLSYQISKHNTFQKVLSRLSLKPVKTIVL